MSLLCLAIWLPATQHCKLENLPGFDFLHCETDTPGNSDCQGDSCDVVEHGAYKVPDNADLVVHPVFAPMLVEPAPVADEEPASFARPLALVFAVPQVSPGSWQFYSSLAVPVRGPSLLS